MTNAEFAVLSLIAEAPRHGYDIEQTIEARGMREWTEVGFSSIYYLLKKLEKAGLIEGQTEQPAGPGPARKVYRITPAGRETCRLTTAELLASTHRSDTPFQLGLANFPALTPAEALTALNAHRAGLEERLAHVRNRREAQRPLPYFVDAMFDYSLALIEAEKTWIEKFIREVEAKNSRS